MIQIKKMFFLGLSLAGLSGCSKSDDPTPVITNATVTGTLAGDSNILYSTATLSGMNEVPAVTTTATGKVLSTFNKTTKILKTAITYSNIVPTAWHIHKAAAGASGSVVFNAGTTFTSPFTYTSAALTADQEVDLLASLYYFNIHSVANPSGEVRAQLSNFAVSLGSGTIVGSFNPTAKTLVLKITYTGITPTAWHIHKGAVGVSGPVVIDLGTSFTSPFNFTSIALTTEQEADLKAGLYYVNIHTAAAPGGEIRAQLAVN
jgi:hypothetical protein